MRRFGLEALVVIGLALGAGLGAATPAPSYQAVTKTIERVRAGWTAPGATADPNAPGWNALFDALARDLQMYSTASTENDKLQALDRLYQVSVALYGVAWEPGVELRENLRAWLRPRVRLAWAGRRLVDTIQAMPAGVTADAQGNRDRWRKFVNNDLGQALHTYEGAATVAQRQKGLRSVVTALNALQTRNQSYPWNPSLELQAALNDLYSLPNLDVSADVNTLAPVFNVNLVTSGPVYRKGYWSQVTAGPKTGFGLMASDDGIAFYNSQLLSSVTPITDFQQQIESDRRGRRAAKMYRFGATSTDSQQLTVVTVIRTTGLEIYPSFAHNVGLNIDSAPQAGGGLQRAIAGLIGFNQPRITQMVWQNAYGPAQQNVEKEAAEMGQERTSAEAAERNQTLRQYLIGYNRLLFRNILIEGLSLRSRPENVLVGGLVTYSGAEGQVGADTPQPANLLAPDSGISVDVHLSSILSNVAHGYIRSPEVQAVNNLLLETHEVPPGAPPSQGIKLTRNVDFPAYLKAVETAAAANNPKVTAVRVQRPEQPPDFGVDNQGNLVGVIRNLTLEVPAPKNAPALGNGPRPRVYRLIAPEAEIGVSFRVEPAAGTEPIRFAGKVTSFEPGAGAKIVAITDDESKGQPLTNFASAIIWGVVRGKLVNQSINMPLNNLPTRGFAIRSVSPLDPSGWVRVVLDRTAEAPASSPAAPPPQPAAPSPSILSTPTAAATPAVVPAGAVATTP